jgi:hypothetical protein
MKTEVISIVGKELFPQRMHLEKEFGEVLYEQVIFVLENIAVENPSAKTYHTDIRLGVYLDSKNDGTRYFELDENKHEKFWNLFANGFYKKFREYSLRQQKLGTDVLFQLNEGSLSMREFENRL